MEMDFIKGSKNVVWLGNQDYTNARPELLWWNGYGIVEWDGKSKSYTMDIMVGGIIRRTEHGIIYKGAPSKWGSGFSNSPFPGYPWAQTS